MKKLNLLFAVALAFITTNAFGVSLPLLPWQDANWELVEALEDRNLERFEALLKKGANPNATFNRGYSISVMCDATDQGALEFLKLAIQYGGDVDANNPDNYSWPRPIFCAISERHRDAIYYLADHGADLGFYQLGTSTPLVEAADAALWDVTYWMLMQREGQLKEFELKDIMRDIEVPDGALRASTDNNVWRFRVLEYLTAKGYKIKPYMGEYECGRRGSVFYDDDCKRQNANPGDIIYRDPRIPILHRQDWERAKAGGPRPNPRE
jgi:hypothetical protein